MTEGTEPVSSQAADPEAEAKACARLHYKDDPFPEVPRSLLSSADIARYVGKTRMLHPFDESKLKSASYEVRPMGEFIYWQKRDGKINRVTEIITKDTKAITLPANSISYIQMEPYFRLPLYIAVRFNLRIKHVHRGILLGTGPIVDPGFSGQLLVPLHNLTFTPYELNLTPNDEDDGLIWLEFTKTSYDATSDTLSKFDDAKKDRSPTYYLHEANGGNPILSSIHDGIEDARQLASTAADNAKRSAASVRNIGVIAFVAALIALGSLIMAGYNVVQGSLSLSATTRQAVMSLTNDSGKVQQDLTSLRSALAIEEAKNKALTASLAAIEGRLAKIETTRRRGPGAHTP
jgi:deoxycytidine triphosphate deaminase